MTILQKWLAGLIGISALYLVLAPSSQIGNALGAASGFVSGTLKTAQGR